MTAERDESWRDEALCRQVDPELWFPEKGADGREAKRICRICPVQSDCREFAIRTRQRDGIWGGMNEKDLRRVRFTRGLAVPRGPRRREGTAA